MEETVRILMYSIIPLAIIIPIVAYFFHTRFTSFTSHEV